MTLGFNAVKRRLLAENRNFCYFRRAKLNSSLLFQRSLWYHHKLAQERHENPYPAFLPWKKLTETGPEHVGVVRTCVRRIPTTSYLFRMGALWEHNNLLHKIRRLLRKSLTQLLRPRSKIPPVLAIHVVVSYGYLLSSVFRLALSYYIYSKSA